MNPKLFFYPERCMLCLSCVLSCQVHSLGISDFIKIPREQRPFQKISVAFARGTPWVWKCQHCLHAPCLEACPSGSLSYEEGKVAHRLETCVGCGSCLLVCPYGIPKYDPKEDRIVKCSLCVEEGVLSCVKACQSRALAYREPNLLASDKKRRFAREFRRARGVE